MKWNKKDFLKLINAYRNQPVIWNSSLKHSNEFKETQAWNNIALEMCRPIEDCKEKMEFLLNGLKKEKIKMKKHNATKKADEPYISPWFAFESMKFLVDETNTPPKCSNTRKRKRSRSDDASASPIQRSRSDDASASPIQEESPTTTKDGIQSGNQNITTTTKDEIPSGDQDIPTTTKNGVRNRNQDARNDECLQFGNLVSSMLMEYDIPVRRAIENDVMNIFLRASKGYYANEINTSKINETNSLRYTPSLSFRNNKQTEPRLSFGAGQSIRNDHDFSGNRSSMDKDYPPSRSRGLLARNISRRSNVFGEWRT